MKKAVILAALIFCAISCFGQTVAVSRMNVSPAEGATIQVSGTGLAVFLVLSPATNLNSLTINLINAPLPSARLIISSTKYIGSVVYGNGTVFSPNHAFGADGFAAFIYEGTCWRRTQ